MAEYSLGIRKTNPHAIDIKVYHEYRYVIVK
jgi:hypothetical protein